MHNTFFANNRIIQKRQLILKLIESDQNVRISAFWKRFRIQKSNQENRAISFVVIRFIEKLLTNLLTIFQLDSPILLKKLNQDKQYDQEQNSNYKFLSEHKSSVVVYKDLYIKLICGMENKPGEATELLQYVIEYARENYQVGIQHKDLKLLELSIRVLKLKQSNQLLLFKKTKSSNVKILESPNAQRLLFSLIISVHSKIMDDLCLTVPKFDF